MEDESKPGMAVLDSEGFGCIVQADGSLKRITLEGSFYSKALEIKAAERRGAERMFDICAKSMPGCAGSPWEPIKADIWQEWEKLPSPTPEVKSSQT